MSRGDGRILVEQLAGHKEAFAPIPGLVHHRRGLGRFQPMEISDDHDDEDDEDDQEGDE